MRVAVIGGAGRMGRWLIKYFVGMGHEVTTSDLRIEAGKRIAETYGVRFYGDNVGAVADADLTVLSVPIKETPRVIDDIWWHLKEGSVLMEISSLKTEVLKKLKDVSKREIKTVSIHPLYGPGADDILEKRIVVIPVIDSEVEAEAVKKLFPDSQLIVMEAEEHDRSMAIVLSLTYFMNTVFAHVLKNFDVKSLKKVGGTTFPLQLILSESILHGDYHLLQSLLLENIYLDALIGEFVATSKKIHRWIKERDEESLRSFFTQIREHLMKDEEFEKAYERKYRALKGIASSSRKESAENR